MTARKRFKSQDCFFFIFSLAQCLAHGNENKSEPPESTIYLKVRSAQSTQTEGSVLIVEKVFCPWGIASG